MPESSGVVRLRPETTSLAIRRTFLSQRRAHAYSVARIANPMGMTMNAGPGNTRRATPISRTVTPITETITRRTTLIFSIFQILDNHFIQDEKRLTSKVRQVDGLVLWRALGVSCSLREASLIVITSLAATRMDRCSERIGSVFDCNTQAVEKGHLCRLDFSSGNVFRKEARLIHLRKFLAPARTRRPLHLE